MKEMRFTREDKQLVVNVLSKLLDKSFEELNKEFGSVMIERMQDIKDRYIENMLKQSSHERYEIGE